MKRIIELLTLTALLLAGCAVKELESQQIKTGEFPIFYASFGDAADETTKTYIDDKRTLRWTKDDRLSIFVCNTFNHEYRYDGETGANNGSFSAISNPEFIAAEPLDANYAIYPYNASNEMSTDGSMSVVLPSAQKYAQNSFGLGANTMVAVTENASSIFLPFKNICGYLVVKVYGEGTVKSVSLKGNNNEKIAGIATISPEYGQNPSVTMANNATEEIILDCGEGVILSTSSDSPTEFWFCIPPTEFTKGFTVTITNTNGEIMKRGTSASRTIVRNVINDMPPLEAEFEPIHTIISARIGSNDTKSAIIDNGYDVSAVWSEKDSITVVDADGVAHICHLKSGAGTDKGIFESEEHFSTDNGQSCYGLFDLPSDGKGGYVWNSNNEYRGDGFYNPMVAWGISDSNEMVFNPAGGIVKLNLKGVGTLGIIEVTSADKRLGGSVKVGEGGNVIVDASGPKTMTLDCGKGLELSENSQKTLYLALPEGDYGGLTFSFIGTNGFFTVKTTKNISVSKNHLHSMPALNLDLTQKFSVDLGLSVDWATCNLGASSPLEGGDYYAWGEVLPYYQEGQNPSSATLWKPGKTQGYAWASYHWCNGSSNTLTKYNTNKSYGSVDDLKILEKTDDAAIYSDSKRRIPTQAEWQELKDNCDVKSFVINGVNGVLCASKVNGDSIFLPASGYFYGTGLSDVNKWGYYWSSSLYTGWPDNSDLNHEYCAWDVSFSGSLSIGYFDRYYGHTIRAVCP